MTAALPEARQKEILGQVPLGRYASADEIAGVVRFLAERRGAATSPGRSSRSTADWGWGTDGHSRGQEDPGHRRADRGVDRLRHGAARAGAGRHRRPVQLRPGAVAVPADRQAAAAGGRRSSSSTSPTPSTCRRWPTGCASRASTSSTASSTRSASRRRRRWATASPRSPWEHAATAFQVSAWSLRLAHPGLPAAVRRTRPRSSGSPSTPPSPGRSTAGWARPRRRWSRRQPLPRPRARPRGRARQHRRRRPAAQHGDEVDPGQRAVRGGVGGAARRWAGRSPTPSPPGKAVVALLSDWFPATTGEIVHVDGGFHAVGV